MNKAIVRKNAKCRSHLWLPRSNLGLHPMIDELLHQMTHWQLGMQGKSKGGQRNAWFVTSVMNRLDNEDFIFTVKPKGKQA